MIPKIIFAALLIGCLFPVIVAGIAPPEDIAERNLEADFIVIGEVMSIKASGTPPHFVVKVEHIIKGFGHLKRGDQIKLVFRLPPPKDTKISYFIQGMSPVKVEVGYLVVVYLERSRSHPGFFKPLLEGSSVVTIGTPLSAKNE